jgi:hypothetical protein
MRLYTIIYIDSKKNGVVITKGCYKSMNVALSDMQNIALNHVKADGGERQETITFQNNKTLDEIKNDNILNTGLYLRNVEDNDIKTIHVYEKTVQDAGLLFSNLKNSIDKIGIFSITEINIDDMLLTQSREISNISLETIYQPKNININKNIITPNIFMNELITLVNAGNGFGLKSIK